MEMNTSSLLQSSRSRALFVFYRCGRECNKMGLVDRLRGAMFGYLLSVALHRPYAVDLGIPCFEQLVTENQVRQDSIRLKLNEYLCIIL